MDHGALEYHECVADDVKSGKHTSFPQGVKLKKGEEVWFSWIVYKSRKDRDRVNAKVMKDPRLARHDGRRRPCRSTASAWCSAASRWSSTL